MCGRRCFRLSVCQGRRRCIDWGVCRRVHWLPWTDLGVHCFIASLNTPLRPISSCPFYRLQGMLCPRLNRGQKSIIKKLMKTPILVTWNILWKYIVLVTYFAVYMLNIYKNAHRNKHIFQTWCLCFFLCCADLRELEVTYEDFFSSATARCGQRSFSSCLNLALKTWWRLHMCETQKIP